MRLLPIARCSRATGVACTAVLLFTAGCAGEISAQEVVAQDAAPPTVADPTAVGASPSAPKLVVRSADDHRVDLFAELAPGTLVVTPDNCIAIRQEQALIGIIWGHGWSAGRDDGRAVVYDANGAVVAREGDRIGLGGGGGDDEYYANRYGEDPCWITHMWAANDTQATRQERLSRRPNLDL
jgi:hypothetical protein